jgi:hypothetical protein
MSDRILRLPVRGFGAVAVRVAVVAGSTAGSTDRRAAENEAALAVDGGRRGGGRPPLEESRP